MVRVCVACHSVSLLRVRGKRRAITDASLLCFLQDQDQDGTGNSSEPCALEYKLSEQVGCRRGCTRERHAW